MAEAKEVVLLITVKDLPVMLGIFFAVVAILLIVIGCLNAKADKLREENRLIRRVLEDYFRLEDGRFYASQAIAREAKRTTWLPRKL